MISIGGLYGERSASGVSNNLSENVLGGIRTPIGMFAKAMHNTSIDHDISGGENYHSSRDSYQQSDSMYGEDSREIRSRDECSWTERYASDEKFPNEISLNNKGVILNISKKLKSESYNQLVEYIKSNDLVQFENLLKIDASLVDKCNKFGQNLLHLSICYSSFDISNYLINNFKYLINQTNVFSLSPLHNAFIKKDSKIVHILIDNGADLGLIDKFGRAPVEIGKINNFSV